MTISSALITVDPHTGVPVYRQLMEQIKLLIAANQLKVGDELPSTRSLSADLKVNPMTVSKAYNLLESEGFIERRRGLPSVVAARDDDDQRASQLELLREQLEPAVRLVSQFGWDREEAIAVMKDLLAEAKKKGAGS